jgi:hypothetical protein
MTNHRQNGSESSGHKPDFYEALKGLARVSKTELDAEERKYKARRERLKAKKEKQRKDDQ